VRDIRQKVQSIVKGPRECGWKRQLDKNKKGLTGFT